MRVLLTGANGFIGSHLLQGLLERGFEVSILLRRTSDTRFIDEELDRVRVTYGGLRSAESLREAVDGAEAVVHCAAKTKALRREEYYAVNAEGTRNLVEACNASGAPLRRFVLVSSLSVSGPGTPADPAREDRRPRPVSDYGRSKMLAERWVRRRCRAPHSIVRPGAVYGPRDRDFLLVFQTLLRGIVPLVNGGRQMVSLIYVRDVVRGILAALDCDAASGGTYHLAHPAPCSQRELQRRIADAMGVRPVPVLVPHVLLYPVCAVQEAAARLTGRPSILNVQKVAEYAAPGWVCATDRAADDLGFVAETPLDEGLRLTLDWYLQHGWLRPR